MRKISTMLGLATAIGGCSERVELGQTRNYVQGTIGSAVELAASDIGMCARTSEQIVACWKGGYPDTVRVVPELGRPERLVSGGHQGYTCTIERGRLACRANLEGGPLTRVDIGSVRDVSVGNWGGCALSDSNQVLCWGNAAIGINGGIVQIEEMIPALQQVELKELPGPAIQVSFNEKHGCALLDDGRVFCFGVNEYGEVDGRPNHDVDAHSHPFVTPVELSGITDAKQVIASASTTCVLHQTGKVSCVGYVSEPELGKWKAYPDRRELPLEDVTAIASSRWTTCALTAAREVYCWGHPTCDMFTHVEGDDSLTPGLASGFGPAKAVTMAHDALLCIIGLDDQVSCRGFRWDYQLGESVCEQVVYDVPL